jgi:putative transport protein
MEINILSLLMSHPEMSLFLIIGVGFLIGKIGAFGIQLGSSIGVLFVALLFGHFGLTISPIVGTIGFIFFIYSVGNQAGPGFFAAFREDGVRYVQLGLVIAIVAVGTSLLASLIFDFEPGYAAGVLAGGLTSTPTLAAAQDAVISGLATIPEGFTEEQVLSNIAVGYAVTYLFGLIGLIIALQIIPKMIKIDLVAEAKIMELEMVKSPNSTEDEMGLGGKGMPSARSYDVTNEVVFGKSLLDLKFLQTTGAVISRMQHNGEDVEPGPETELHSGDRILVLGYNQSQVKAAELIGKEVYDSELEKTPFETRRFMVSNAEIAQQTLRDSGITNRFACITNRLTRGGVDLPISMETIIYRGDYIVVSGPKDNIERLIAHIGRVEQPIHETDLVSFCFGIVAGLFVGYTSVSIGNLPLGIGTAGGLLTVGLVIGWARTIHPMFGRVPPAARFILMELGLFLFLAGVGIRAGSGLVEGLMNSGIGLFLGGAAVTLIPAFSGIYFGKYVLKMNPAILFGAMTGGLTSTPALAVVTKQAKSNVPAIGYVGVYAFANIILTLAGQIMMIF